MAGEPLDDGAASARAALRALHRDLDELSERLSEFGEDREGSARQGGGRASAQAGSAEAADAATGTAEPRSRSTRSDR